MGTRAKILISSIVCAVLLSITVSVVYKDRFVSIVGDSQVMTEEKNGETSHVAVKEEEKELTTEKETNSTSTEQQSVNKTVVEPIQQEQLLPVTEQPKVNEAGYIDNQPLPTKPTYVKGVLIANKKYPLPANYSPGIVPEAQMALNTMIAAAQVNGFEITAFSAFRSYDYQKQLYTNYVQKDGQKAADRYSARPGYSEHQTGLAFDIGEVGRKDLWLTEEFGESSAGKWLYEHAHEYGFILRYPKGKEAITGYMYESWHFRYVGIELAKEIHNKNVTLEEYLNIQ